MLVADDDPQAARARRLFEANEVWIGVTVLLEAAWVLPSVYGLTAKDTAAAPNSRPSIEGWRMAAASSGR